ncbi:hypothetical protein FGG08_006660 [Glutinoglossum americanum]|uniref:Uncharacterized protein n=1 Tax=Glutinoglossum americanum TaxID=1670608 RepID=A0A9P8I312_9PEZI|nr:hypothetical protein FGG08_006660 [Glutinoglossum americanum]
MAVPSTKAELSPGSSFDQASPGLPLIIDRNKVLAGELHKRQMLPVSRWNEQTTRSLSPSSESLHCQQRLLHSPAICPADTQPVRSGPTPLSAERCSPFGTDMRAADAGRAGTEEEATTEGIKPAGEAESARFAGAMWFEEKGQKRSAGASLGYRFGGLP